MNQIRTDIKKIRDLRKGYFTNLFFNDDKFSLWIKKDVLYFEFEDESVLFFRKNRGFFNVFFCSVSLDKLKNAITGLRDKYPNTIFVFDIVGTSTNTQETIRIFNSTGYSLYTKLVRMSRLVEGKEQIENHSSIKNAEKENIGEIQFLLNKYFNAFAEQLPMDEEIISWIDKKNIFCYMEQNRVIGFVIFDLIGMTSYLRYWFVHPDYRNKRIGSSLIRRFFIENREAKRQLFWVIENNYNAIVRYQHYGFMIENLVDFVFININKKYEKRGN